MEVAKIESETQTEIVEEIATEIVEEIAEVVVDAVVEELDVSRASGEEVVIISPSPSTAEPPAGAPEDIVHGSSTLVLPPNPETYTAEAPPSTPTQSSSLASRRIHGYR